MEKTWLLAAALVVAAGCSSPSETTPIDGEAAAAPAPTAEPTERPADSDPQPDPPLDNAEPDPPVEDEDPWAVPDEIGEDYVQAVLDEILARDSELVLEVLESELERFPSEDQMRRLASLWNGPAGRTEAISFQHLVQLQEHRDAQRPPEEYGTKRFDVERLQVVEPGCVTVLGWYDLTETAIAPYDPDTYAAVVLAYQDDLDPELNPTGWRIWDTVLLTTGDDEPVSLDQVSEENLGPVLDLACEDRR